jgi:CcmD family protein
LFLFAQAQPPVERPAPSTPNTTEQRSTSFRSVQGGEALQSGEKLLVEAYSVIWVLVFGMLLFSWRRQRKMDERIAGLEQAVTAARASTSSSASSSAAKAGKAPASEEAP